MDTQTAVAPLTNSDYQHYFEKGISYSEYLENMTEEAENPIDSPNSHFVPMNLQRAKRIGKTVKLTDDILATLNRLQHPIKWLVISEHWCGDASQIMPVLHQIAANSNGKIDMRIVYRDQHLELMDAHLTGTSRSIPKLIQLDQQFGITATWGPRSAEAQRMVLELKSNPETAATYSEILHTWYAKDKQQAIQQELNLLLSK